MDWLQLERVEFSVTTYCQAKCPLCARISSKTLEKAEWINLRHLKASQYKNAVDQLLPNRIIDFCGDYGDPMMHPEIGEFIDYAIQKGHKVVLHTNGGIRSPEWYSNIAKKYKSQDCLCMCFALDGIDHETNSKYRVGVDFDRALENMLAFAKESSWHSTVWNFLVFDFNYHQMDDIKELCEKNNIIFLPHMNERVHKNYDHLIKDNILKKQLEEKCDSIYSPMLTQRVASYVN